MTSRAAISAFGMVAADQVKHLRLAGSSAASSYANAAS
jgi:hypothetical protein